MRTQALSVRPLVRNDRVEKWENERFRYFLCMFVCGRGVGVWMGVGCPCPPVRNDIVTPRHLFRDKPIWERLTQNGKEEKRKSTKKRVEQEWNKRNIGPMNNFIKVCVCGCVLFLLSFHFPLILSSIQ